MKMVAIINLSNGIEAKNFESEPIEFNPKASKEEAIEQLKKDSSGYVYFTSLGYKGNPIWTTNFLVKDSFGNYSLNDSSKGQLIKT